MNDGFFGLSVAVGRVRPVFLLSAAVAPHGEIIRENYRPAGLTKGYLTVG